MNELRNLSDDLKSKIGSGVVVLASAMGSDKVNLIVTATDDIVKAGVHAGNIIKSAAPCVGGGGGGRPNMARGQVERIRPELKRLLRLLKKHLHQCYNYLHK